MPCVLSAPHAASKVSAITFSSPCMSTEYTGILRVDEPKNTLAVDVTATADTNTMANILTTIVVTMLLFFIANIKVHLKDSVF